MAAPSSPQAAMPPAGSSSPRPAPSSPTAGAAAAAPSSPPSGSASTTTARLEAAVDEAIAACDGDLRAAVRALILANDYLEQELCAMFTAVSRGYARGRFAARGAEADRASSSP